MYQNFVSKLWNLCDEWQLVCHRLVDQTIVTHSHTSPSERSHSSDMISWKNRIQTRHIGLQNVETKSGPKISSQTCGRKIAHPKLCALMLGHLTSYYKTMIDINVWNKNHYLPNGALRMIVLPARKRYSFDSVWTMALILDNERFERDDLHRLHKRLTRIILKRIILLKIWLKIFK